MKEFIFLWNPDKTSVYLPESFKSQFAEDQAEIPLIFIDDNGNKESFIYNLVHNSIQLKALQGWVNDFQPNKNEKIVLIHQGGFVYKITISGREEKQYEGLYLGKIIIRSFGDIINFPEFLFPVRIIPDKFRPSHDLFIMAFVSHPV